MGAIRLELGSDILTCCVRIADVGDNAVQKFILLMTHDSEYSTLFVCIAFPLESCQ